MPVVAPHDISTDPNDPNVDTNDMVMDMNMNILFQDQPLNVKAWLETPGNMGDTTQVLVSKNGNAIVPWNGKLLYASDYLNNFYNMYPNLVGQ